jgi:catechol 2,3-dioxygenase-like lactoylglutathione lyase family enzyme
MTRTEADYVDRGGPETLRLRAIRPMLTVNDLDATLAFYRDQLGFVVAQEWNEGGGRGALIRAGATEIMLNQDDFKKGKDREKNIGVRLMCETAQGIDDMADAIKSRGGTLDQEPTTHPWGVRDFVVTDPDGLKISVSDWNPGEK